MREGTLSGVREAGGRGGSRRSIFLQRGDFAGSLALLAEMMDCRLLGVFYLAGNDWMKADGVERIFIGLRIEFENQTVKQGRARGI